MSIELSAGFATRLTSLAPAADQYVPDLIRLILVEARRHRASDVHLVPTESGLTMQWRIDGVLHAVAGFDRELAGRMIARLKVICGLLTYRTDVPQEGRVSREHSTSEIRVTTFPTLYGEKAAIRMFADHDSLQTLDQLGLPSDILDAVRIHLSSTAGVLLWTGPSGSGKTTSAYACLREILVRAAGTRCVMTLEDPVEVAVEGATQSQVRASAGFDLAAGLRSMMRQDPDVIMVGEIRDPGTAEAAFQAALTGHLVLSTFHAGSAVEALTRLLDMQIEPYLLRSGLRAIVCQRLLRQLCAVCGRRVSQASENLFDSSEMSDKSVPSIARASACARCGSTGYHGRFVIAEMLDPNVPDLARGILSKADSRVLGTLAESIGMITLRNAASMAVVEGRTSLEEVVRVLGRF
ncbi:MAG: GspE/PulE family protein [Planctomycetota bacterium]